MISCDKSEVLDVMSVTYSDNYDNPVNKAYKLVRRVIEIILDAT